MTIVSLLMVLLLLFLPLMMPVASSPVLDAARQSFPDAAELSVSQVQPKLLYRPPQLHPGMSPAVDAVEGVFVFHVFDNVGGMSQRELQFVAFHRELFPQASRHQFHLRGVVGTVLHAYAVDEVEVLLIIIQNFQKKSVTMY
jgi:hypothetical protein